MSSSRPSQTRFVAGGTVLFMGGLAGFNREYEWAWLLACGGLAYALSILFDEIRRVAKEQREKPESDG